MGDWSYTKELISRFKLFGATLFEGKRDLYGTFGYRSHVTFEDRFAKYLRQDVAGRIIDAPAAALWTNPPIIESSLPDWTEKWGNLVERYNLYSALERCDRLAGIGRYSVLLIGYNDGRKLSEPVNTRAISQKKDNAIVFLQPYSERSVKIKALDTNHLSATFMQPLLYEIQPSLDSMFGIQPTAGFIMGNPISNGPVGALTVHASRIVHIAENILENGVYGSPRMERVYNILDDLLKVTGGSAETYWLTANRGLHVDIDKEIETTPGDEEALAEEIDEYQHNLRRVLRTRGTSVTSIGSDVADPRGVYAVLLGVLAGATGIPQRILIGSEAGQLASEQDRANWADRIDERRLGWANPLVLFKLIKNLTVTGYLPAEEVMSITVQWPSAFKMSPLESAQTSAQHARSATNFAKAIETMSNLNRGEPGSADTTDPMTGKVTPGTPAVEGLDLGDLVSVDEARKFIGLDKPQVTFNSGLDVGGNVRARVQTLLPLRNNMRVDVPKEYT